MKTFREYLRESENKEVNEGGQVFTKKDVNNSTLDSKTAILGIDLLNSMENSVNTYMRLVLFDKANASSVKNYERIFNEFADDFKKFTKLVVSDYKN